MHRDTREGPGQQRMDTLEGWRAGQVQSTGNTQESLSTVWFPGKVKGGAPVSVLSKMWLLEMVCAV